MPGDRWGCGRRDGGETRWPVGGCLGDWRTLPDER